jgi:3' exoribonuclease, RNase T-like
MTMGVFFDTEFTQFVGSRLISIGCVSDDGRAFYAELSDTYQQSDCSNFVIETVLPLLAGGECKMMEAQLVVRLKAWVEQFGDEVVLRSDSPFHDWPFVEYLFSFYGMWPTNLRRKCGHVHFRQPRHQQRYEEKLRVYWQTHSARQHHALVDAMSLRFAWWAVVKGGSESKV